MSLCQQVIVDPRGVWTLLRVDENAKSQTRIAAGIWLDLAMVSDGPLWD